MQIKALVSVLPSGANVELTAGENPPFRLTGRGYGIKLQNLYYKLHFQVFGAAESVFGPRVVSWLLAPIVRIDLWRRRRDFAHFVELRATLSPEFWKGLT